MSPSPVTLTGGHTTPMEAARQHETAARQLAAEALTMALTALGDAMGHCRDLAGFELAPPGVRDVLRLLGDRIEADLNTIQSISGRTA